MPEASVITGRVCGSHSASTCPFSTIASGSTSSRVPLGSFWRSFSRPTSS